MGEICIQSSEVSDVFTGCDGKRVKEDYIIEVKITDPEGKQICTNVKLTESDMELFHTLKDLKG